MTTNLNTLGRNMIANTVTMINESEVTNSQLAEFSGISKRTVQRIQAARKTRQTYNPMLKTVVKLAELAGVTVDEYIKTRLIFN